MRNANWTRILTILLAILALYALLAVAAGVIQRFIVPLLLVILAAILAFVLSPVVDFIQNRLHLFRWLSILLTYLTVAVVLAGLGFFLTAPLIAQTRSLADAIKNPTHLTNVVRVKDQTGKIAGKSIAYAAAAGSGHAGAAAAYVGSLRACQGVAPGLCLPSAKPQAVTIPALVHTLRTDLLPDLHKSSLRPAPNRATHNRGRFAPLPTTKVPPSYIKPIHQDLQRLRADLSKARQDFAHPAPPGRSPPLGVDASRVHKAAKRLNRDAKHMYSIVKSTPIFLLALQIKIDQHHWPIDIRSLFGKAVGKIGSQGSSVLNNAVAILTSTITVIFDVFIIIIMSFYLLADGGRFISWVLGLVPEGRREQAWFFIESLNGVLGGYIRGQVIVAITIGILAGTGSYLLGVPYALLIGIFAFLAESIPVIGPVLASIPAILVSLFTQSILKTLLVIGWFIVVQQIEQNIVGPRITGHAVGIHPVVAMVAIIVGLEIGGFWGAFLAVPVTGLLQVLARTGYNSIVRQEPLPTSPVPESVEVVEEEEQRSHSPPAAG